MFRGIADGLWQALGMGWETLWALVLGFTLSGAIQAFVPRAGVRRALSPGVGGILRATLLGAVSSSCSYAAAAMARSLYAKGADFTAALVFMVASTNLVIELGIVLAVLIGWQFAAATIAGGLTMIVLLAAAARFTLPRPALRDAAAGERQRDSGNHDAVRHAVRSRSGWAQAARFTISDIRMLRREMLIGFTVAGLLSALVPARVWGLIFWQGHGFGAAVENALAGPAVAIASFVCSIGNVPLAAALWRGGISFGGVISFLLADLITLPLLLVYRRMYGWRLTAWILVTFWGVMAMAGLAVQSLATALGLVPGARAVGTDMASSSLLTGVLNTIALLVLLMLWRLARSASPSSGFATDPVCGMQVDKAAAPADTLHAGTTIYFCSDGCRERFMRNPTRSIGPEVQPVGASAAAGVDPICGMTVAFSSAAAVRERNGIRYPFCCTGCAERFDTQTADAPDSVSSHA